MPRTITLQLGGGTVHDVHGVLEALLDDGGRFNGFEGFFQNILVFGRQQRVENAEGNVASATGDVENFGTGRRTQVAEEEGNRVIWYNWYSVIRCIVG